MTGQQKIEAALKAKGWTPKEVYYEPEWGKGWTILYETDFDGCPQHHDMWEKILPLNLWAFAKQGFIMAPSVKDALTIISYLPVNPIAPVEKVNA
jgi:hypothetical protein